MATSVVRYRFTVEDYHRMAAAGILGEDDRVELIAGEIVEMGPVGPVHVACVALLNTLLATQVGPDVLISVQSPIRLPDNTEPQPDLALLRRRDYRAALPGPADVLLVIEVADTSRDYDRTIKLPRYAAAGIPESWLLDLVARRLERHSDPGPDGYRQITLAWPGDTLASTVLPDIVLDVAAALGDR